MKKLKLPQNAYTGLKIYCNKCKTDNPNCKHYEHQKYRLRLHVSGTSKTIKVKTLVSKNYEDAVKEAIDFKKEIIANNYESVVKTETGNDYSVTGAILKYYQYLDGNHEYTQMKKDVSSGHRDEQIRYCTYFSHSIKTVREPSTMKVSDVNKTDVARFYTWAENHYQESTFNKCMSGMKAFFNFLIDVEEIQMKNPFNTYESKSVAKSDIQSLSRDEFEAILKAVDEQSPMQQLGGRGERKNMYKPYLIDGFKLFLLTGGRREEIVDIRWKDIYTSIKGVKFFKILNIKVYRSTGKETFKYIPIGSDLFNLLVQMGYDDKKHTDDFILFPERNAVSKTIMDSLSKSFTHYKKSASIDKAVSLKNLRKTYLTWVNSVMLKDTRILSNHTTDEVLERFYIDPTILSSIEKGVLEIKVFG